MGNYIKKVICTLIAITTILVSSVTYIDTVKAEGKDETTNTSIIAYAFKNNDSVSIDRNDNITFYANLGYTIVLNKDIDISDPFYVSGNWTIKMNGHKIYRSYSSTVNNGEIFHLWAYQTLNLLGVGDSRVPGSSDSVQNREFTYQGYRPDDSTNSNTTSELTVTTGGLITGGNNSGSAGAIYMCYGSTLNLNNVAVNGNASSPEDESTGAIYLAKRTSDDKQDKDFTINMVNSHIDHNYSITDEEFSGGGITIEESDTKVNLKMTESSIDYNISAKSVGGGIYSKGKLYIEGDYKSTVSHNYSDNCGGGIYVDDYFEIRKIQINNNYANAKSGGIGIDADNGLISDCTINNNTARGEGSAAYINSSETTFMNCTVTGNRNIENEYGSTHAAIYVYRVYDIIMSGKNVVENNFTSEGTIENIYLDEGAFSKSYIRGSTTEGAHIGITAYSSGNKKVGDNITNYVEGRYYSDNPGNLHLVYHADEKALYQEKGESTKYKLTVNGTVIGSYYAGKQVTISDNNQDTEKIFLSWDTSNAEGLDYVTIPKEEQVFTIAMPSNDVSIDAKYLDRLTSLKLTVIGDSPTAGRYLPESVKYTYGPDGASQSSWDLEWLEVNDEGMTPTSGRAKYNTTYAFKLQIAKNIDRGLVFSDSIQPENITIKYGDGKEITAKSVSIDEAGTLTIISEGLQTESKAITVNSFESTSITVQEGISKDDLINALPSTAIGIDTEGNEDIYTVNKDLITPDMLTSLISDDEVIRPESGRATIEIPSSMINKPDNVTFTEDITFSVTVNVNETITVETPTVTKDSGTYSGTKLVVEATTATQGATIYYTIDGGETQTYDSNLGIVLTTEANTGKTFNVTLWAKKDDISSDTLELTYTLDGQITAQKTVTINCSDTPIEKPWTASVTKSYDTGTKVTVYAPTYEGRAFEKWVYINDEGKTVESYDSYLTFASLNEDKTIKAIYNPVITAISFNIPYPEAGKALATKDDISVTATIAGVTIDFSGYFDLNNLTWLPNAVVADYETSYTAKLPILHNTQGSKFKVADKLVVMVNGNTDKRLIVNLDKSRENAYVTFPETDVKPYVPTPTPTPTASSDTKKSSGGWDDGGPFTTDSCGNVYDRWGNIIYEAKGCNVGGYNLVQTDTK